MTTPLQGITTPTNATAPNTLGGAVNMTFVNFEKQLILEYPNATARDTAITSPVAGMIAYLTTPGIHTWYTGSAWKSLMMNVTQDVPGDFFSGGSAAPGLAYEVFNRDITVSGPCVLEAECTMTLNMAAPPSPACSGLIGIRIGGINVRNFRWNNHGASGLFVATLTGVANVPAAGIINVAFDMNSDSGSASTVSIDEVNYAIRERSAR